VHTHVHMQTHTHAHTRNMNISAHALSMIPYPLTSHHPAPACPQPLQKWSPAGPARALPPHGGAGPSPAPAPPPDAGAGAAGGCGCVQPAPIAAAGGGAAARKGCSPVRQGLVSRARCRHAEGALDLGAWPHARTLMQPRGWRAPPAHNACMQNPPLPRWVSIPAALTLGPAWRGRWTAGGP